MVPLYKSFWHVTKMNDWSTHVHFPRSIVSSRSSLQCQPKSAWQYIKSNCSGRIMLSAFCICDANLSVPHFKFCNLHWAHHRSICWEWHAVRGRIMFTLLFFKIWSHSSVSNESQVKKGGEIRWNQRWSVIFLTREQNFSNQGEEYDWIHCVGSQYVTIRVPTVWAEHLWARIAEYTNEISRLRNVSAILSGELSHRCMQIWCSIWKNHFIGKGRNLQGEVEVIKVSVLGKFLIIILWTIFKPRVLSI